ncbi:LOW QUALITY PROTEIN: POL-like protein [Mya arenaria]|uniref:POL-like protein n=1 Tax=Mya arenaria TaxID=6604 RepID=A0ABY7G9D3_MYAAR|nr:LOW QUALITY PROTEIN: POL-like protein [Mya arenaria]
MQNTVISETHKTLAHLGIDKTYDAKYYWVYLFKLEAAHNEVHLFKKMTHLHLLVCYRRKRPLSAEQLCISFIDLYSGYPEAFPTPTKDAQIIAHILIDEIFPRYSCRLEILSDNGSENVNRVVKETLATLNIHHVTTSVYHPQSNGVIERYHRTIVDVISKKIHSEQGSWDLFLNKALAAIRFGVNVFTKCSPFFLLFNREVIMPIDTILKPRRKYLSHDPH